MSLKFIPKGLIDKTSASVYKEIVCFFYPPVSLSGVPDYFGRKWISSGGDLSHYSSASLY